ncbi:MAG: hypothetical protein ACO1Q7_08350 [Gemmatimonas sp.]
MKSGFTLATLLGCAMSVSASAQTGVPVRTLTKPEVTTLLPFGAIESVRPLANGAVLVNDNGNRQLVMLDSAFRSTTVVLDSSASAGVYYGTSTSPLLAYPGDSTAFLDVTTRKFIIIDPQGNVAHRLENTKPGQAVMPLTGPRGFDADGNALMLALPDMGLALSRMRNDPNKMQAIKSKIVRANFTTRAYDELSYVETTSSGSMSSSVGKDGQRVVRQIVNPLPVADDWTVLSNGSLAVVRAGDYRVEMFDGNGRNKRTVTIPYTKRKLTDADKQHIIDSATVNEIANRDPNDPRLEQLGAMLALQSIPRDSIQRVLRRGNGRFIASGTVERAELPLPEYVPLKEMPDYPPAFKSGALRSDLDARLWILATHTDPASQDTFYDVVNNLAEYVQRVRVPAGRTIAGFGKGGAVYLKFRDGNGKWMLERVRIAQ